jgi:hypothetical protein
MMNTSLTWGTSNFSFNEEAARRLTDLRLIDLPTEPAARGVFVLADGPLWTSVVALTSRVSGAPRHGNNQANALMFL